MMRAASLFVLVVMAAGCRESRGVRWEIAITDPDVRGRTAVVAAEVRGGTCAVHGEVVYTIELEPTDTAPPVPTLGGGVHSFAASVRDADCVEIGAGCTDVVLPAEPDHIVRTLALASTSTTPECEGCVAGRCASAGDAGAL